MLQAVYRMREDANFTFRKGFAMVTSTPAAYANLDDRGVIAEGKRADIIVIDDTNIPKSCFNYQRWVNQFIMELEVLNYKRK